MLRLIDMHCEHINGSFNKLVVHMTLHSVVCTFAH